MGTIKDIIDLAKDLESRVKDRKDIDTLRAIISQTQAIQAYNADVIERDIRVMQENAQLVAEVAKLKLEIATAKAEEIRIWRTVELRRGSRTGGIWNAFCPKCHMPASIQGGAVLCSDADCNWQCDATPSQLMAHIQQI
jgi:hypothetical protein